MRDKSVTCIDASPGTGKSVFLANMIANSDPDTRWLVITPYLTEVHRLSAGE